ncbi:DUF805 domain-containing protein [Aquisalinus flavus]|uniref:DUF805 domain-containing protein n=1 Tax=Aquisalinus flavus TaxID=1526572 RepID=A0A8J2V4G0_9PROT|nr:DUF805 domain-containing protein [Aquisalinus flavus]MBD0426419.1 DUF805 domain-containing protein [Aquisalinus flavus]UNE48026.1 DUF805 domain-containing protein [Aquisalinus flavus]GGD08068.1 DUF805 domain-containing protein [Aquisalinus flavus]
MGFVDAVKTVYTNYVNFQGRSGRAEFWWFVLFYLIVVIVLSLLGEVGRLLSTLFWLASILPGLGVSVRRLHDTGHSGWWILLNLIPLIGFIILIIMSYARASQGPNQYGPPAEGGGAMPISDDSTAV